MRIFLLSCATAFLWASCQTGTVETLSGDVPKLYVLKCAKCHELYDPKKYDDADWGMWMKKMRKKSRLKPEQFEAIQNYTEELRSREISPIQSAPGK